jgi:hypothetical protein
VKKEEENGGAASLLYRRSGVGLEVALAQAALSGIAGGSSAAAGERGNLQVGRGAGCDASSGPDVFKIQFNSKTDSTLIQSKSLVPRLQKFTYKYGVAAFEVVKNFCNWIMFIFKTEIELKNWEVKVYF